MVMAGIKNGDAGNVAAMPMVADKNSGSIRSRCSVATVLAGEGSGSFVLQSGKGGANHTEQRNNSNATNPGFGNPVSRCQWRLQHLEYAARKGRGVQRCKNSVTNQPSYWRPLYAGPDASGTHINLYPKNDNCKAL